MGKATPAATATPAIDLGSDWFDPLEEAVRGQVRAFIEQLLEEELAATLGRGRYERGPASKGRRNGHRERQLSTTFGPLVLAVPRARVAEEAGEREWRKRAAAGLPASEPACRAADRPGPPRRGHQHPAGAPRARDPVRRPQSSGQGRLDPRTKDAVSRAWRRTRAAWEPGSSAI